jgi:hypothetical protein
MWGGGGDRAADRERMAYASCASEEDLASVMLNTVRKRAGCSIV